MASLPNSGEQQYIRKLFPYQTIQMFTICLSPKRLQSLEPRPTRREKGIWETVFAELSAGGDFEMVMPDSTIVRAHQHAAGAPKKMVNKQLGDLVVV